MKFAIKTCLMSFLSYAHGHIKTNSHVQLRLLKPKLYIKFISHECSKHKRQAYNTTKHTQTHTIKTYILKHLKAY